MCCHTARRATQVQLSRHDSLHCSIKIHMSPHTMFLSCTVKREREESIVSAYFMIRVTLGVLYTLEKTNELSSLP